MLTKEASSLAAIILITEDASFVSMTKAFNSLTDNKSLNNFHFIDAYEMVIAVADNPKGGRLPVDPLTEPTIRAIFYDFFRSKEHVIIYICDSSDGCQEARFRKFTSWYYKNIAVDLFKMDARLPDGDRFTLLSGILSKKNPYFSQFVELFKHLAEADTEK